jgi:bacterioferritin
MKDNEKLLSVLNKILLDELKALDRNMFHSVVSDNLGYEELYKEIEKETTEELKQAEWLIKRIIFLEVWRTRQPSINVSQNNSKDSEEKRVNFG